MLYFQPKAAHELLGENRFKCALKLKEKLRFFINVLVHYENKMKVKQTVNLMCTFHSIFKEI